MPLSYIAQRSRSMLYAAVFILLLVSACSPECDAGRTEPAPARAGQQNTITASNEGTRMIITAGVTAMLSPRAFVVRDADLPDQGLLVLSDARTDLRSHDVVTVYGVIRQFDHARFTDQLDQVEPAAYQKFEGQKILVAADVSSRA